MHNIDTLLSYLDAKADAHERFAQSEEHNIQYADHGAYGQSRRRAAEYRETAQRYRSWAAGIRRVLEEKS